MVPRKKKNCQNGIMCLSRHKKKYILPQLAIHLKLVDGRNIMYNVRKVVKERS